MSIRTLEELYDLFFKPVAHRLFFYGEIKEHAVFLPFFEKHPIEYAISGRDNDRYPLALRRGIASGMFPMILVRYDIRFQTPKTHEELYRTIEKKRDDKTNRAYWFACVTGEYLVTAVTRFQETFEDNKCTTVQSKKADVREHFLSASANDYLWQFTYAIEPLPEQRGSA